MDEKEQYLFCNSYECNACYFGYTDETAYTDPETEAGYGTAAGKRMEIAEHMRYLPMGYFNEKGISICTASLYFYTQAIMPISYDLKGENIDFAYEEKKIISNVTINIPEKTTTAIVGPFGSGKTTLCHLLSRFWDVDSGKVTLDNRDIREYSMDSLVENFSFVFQNVDPEKDATIHLIKLR